MKQMWEEKKRQNSTGDVCLYNKNVIEPRDQQYNE